jgi:hypothetical protein
MYASPRASLRSLALGVISLLMVAAAITAHAQSISFSPNATLITTTSGGTVTFDGTVTNDSGAAMSATDFFFNFFSYNSGAVTPIQDLGVTTNFSLTNGATSPLLPLFDVTLAMEPAGSRFPLEVQLEDVNGDLSATETVTVAVKGGSSAVPEPPTLFLLVMGLLALGAARRWRGAARS